MREGEIYSGFNLGLEILLFDPLRSRGRIVKVMIVSISDSRFFSLIRSRRAECADPYPGFNLGLEILLFDP